MITRFILLGQYIENFYLKHGTIVKTLIKLLFILGSVLCINRFVGYHPVLTTWYAILITTLLCVAMPDSVVLALILTYAVINVYYVSPLLAVFMILIFVIMYLMFLRFEPIHTYFILGIILLHIVNLQYLVPVLLAVFYGPAVVVSMSCGIIIYYMLTSITATIGVNQDTTILINHLLNQFVTNIPFQEELLIFALVLVVVYLIRSSEINYAFNISIVVGLFLEMTLFLIIDFFAGEDLNILYFILEIIACFVIAYVVVFFKYSLNFQHVERLQFEDDEYYYYVKAVPKHKVNAPERSVKHFRPRRRARHNLKELEEVEMFLEAEDAKEKKETEEK